MGTNCSHQQNIIPFSRAHPHLTLPTTPLNTPANTELGALSFSFRCTQSHVSVVSELNKKASRPNHEGSCY